MDRIPLIDVLIVGGGPAGLFCATEIARHGESTLRIVDRLCHPNPLSRAIGIHARTLEVLPDIEAFLHRGYRCGKAFVFTDGKKIAEIYLDKIPSEYKYACVLPQDETEEILTTYLDKTYSIQLERETEIINIEEIVHPEIPHPIVKATAKNLNDNSLEVIYAKWVIACDGAKSTVRRLLNIPFVGETIETTWITGDVIIEEPGFPEHDTMSLCLSPKGFLAFFPLNADRRFRVALDLPHEEHKKFQAEQEITLEYLQHFLFDRLPEGMKITCCHPKWVAAFKINERRIETMRKGHVMFIGDAAHVHSPAGGQGMNTGIQDAHNLAWKLALILKGKGKEDILLRSFCEERETNAARVLKNTGNLRTVISLESKILQNLRNLILPYLTSVEFVKKNIAANMAELDISYYNSPLTSHYGDPKGIFSYFQGKILGARLPYFHLTRMRDKKTFSSTDIIRNSTRHHLFYFCDPGYNLEYVMKLLAPYDLQLHIIAPEISVQEEQEQHPNKIEYWNDTQKEFEVSFAVQKRQFLVLVRPDGYISLIGDENADIVIKDHLDSYLIK